MKAMLCKAYGPPESLVLEEAGLAAPEPDEVRVRVRAAGVNFPDVLMIQGKYQFKPPFPFAPGSECAGDVIAVGDKVSDFKPGDRVIALTGHGAFAEEANVRAIKCLPLPDDVDYRLGAAFVLTYGTSIYALKQRAQLKAGEWLLVHGASGGVGLAAVEIGKAMGAHVIGTGGNDDKLKTVLEHGADHVINYNDGPFKDRVKEICGGAGADVIYDAVGGDVFDQSLRCINWDGRLLVIGFASGRIPEAPVNLTLLKNCSIVGVFWGAWTEREPQGNRDNVAELFQWYREGKLKPHISHEFGLAEVP
ncbi:MAG TPA: NADPH:quinone oxidoreductase family protein, partial [Alphaproteobacteria bacterium]|nr:NADPH:quinone oxidoreductase family protein [Alphaproteobacteria bacterium]